jgi:TRAP-type C4-dicarboxylate transport system permease small subunit
VFVVSVPHGLSGPLRRKPGPVQVWEEQEDNMKRFYDSLEKSLRITLLVLVGGIVATTMLQIVARFILMVSIPWTDELARYLMIWASFVGLGVAYRKRELICVAFFREKLRPHLVKVALLVSDLLCSIFTIVIVIYGVKLCLQNVGQVSPSMRISLGIIYAVVPLGCLLFLLFAFESVFSYFSMARR